jgi:hypothetical protein
MYNMSRSSAHGQRQNALHGGRWWACSAKTKDLPINCQIDAPLEWLFHAVFSGARRKLPIVVHGGQAKENYMRLKNRHGLPDAIYCSHFSPEAMSNHERDTSLTEMPARVQMATPRRCLADALNRAFPGNDLFDRSERIDAHFLRLIRRLTDVGV